MFAANSMRECAPHRIHANAFSSSGFANRDATKRWRLIREEPPANTLLGEAWEKTCWAHISKGWCPCYGHLRATEEIMVIHWWKKNQYSHCLSRHNNKNIMFFGLLWCFLSRYTYIMIWMNILRHQKHDVLLVSLPRCEALKRTARSTHFQGMVYRIRAIIF